MIFEHEVKPNGDLEIKVIEYDEGEHGKFWEKEFKESWKSAYDRSLEKFCEGFFPDTAFEFLDEHDKIRLGHLYGGDVLTDLDVHEDADIWNLPVEERKHLLETRQWFFRPYQVVSFLERLFMGGFVSWSPITPTPVKEDK